MTSRVLRFPNFSVPFVVETDACDVGIGVILLQEEHPIAYFSKKLSSLCLWALTYSKELWAITEVVQKWRHYLLGSDHSSLKNLVVQVIRT